MRLIDAAFTVYAAESEFDEEDASKIRWLISHIPTVDAKPARHGEWIKENIRAKSYLRLCSACGKIAYFCGTGCSYKYCPNCGAKMRNDNENK